MIPCSSGGQGSQDIRQGQTRAMQSSQTWILTLLMAISPALNLAMIL